MNLTRQPHARLPHVTVLSISFFEKPTTVTSNNASLFAAAKQHENPGEDGNQEINPQCFHPH